MMGVQFRLAGDSDARELSRMYNQLRQCELALLNEKEKDIQEHWEQKMTEETVLNMIQDPNHFIVIAESEGGTVGFAGCRIGIAPDGFKEGYLDIFVKEEYRGKGVGSKLLDWIEEQARANGCGALSLSVYSKNKLAEKFYEQKKFFVLSKGMKKRI